jgi:hypothetical protein
VLLSVCAVTYPSQLFPDRCLNFLLRINLGVHNLAHACLYLLTRLNRDFLLASRLVILVAAKPRKAQQFSPPSTVIYSLTLHRHPCAISIHLAPSITTVGCAISTLSVSSRSPPRSPNLQHCIRSGKYIRATYGPLSLGVSLLGIALVARHAILQPFYLSDGQERPHSLRDSVSHASRCGAPWHHQANIVGTGSKTISSFFVEAKASRRANS